MSEKPTIRETITQILRDTYACTRVWEAWQVGTMDENDFHPAWEDDEILNDLEEAFGNHITAELEASAIREAGLRARMKTLAVQAGHHPFCTLYDDKACNCGFGGEFDAVERLHADLSKVRDELERIAGDYQPVSGNDAPLALDEMRGAVCALFHTLTHQAALASAPADGWIRVDDSDPDSIPKEARNVLVAARVPFQDEGFHVTETTFYPDWKVLLRGSRDHPPSRKVFGKYSRHFEACWSGYVIHYWMPKPLPPAPEGKPNGANI